MERVALIDYGSGNLRSAEKALYEVARRAGSDVEIRTTDDPDYIRRADRLVLPGVGAFTACMDALEARTGVIEAMTEACVGRSAPFLGICVGMQLLATRGLEFGMRRGLDWIGGEVRKLEPADHRAKIPHMGWNTLSAGADHPLFAPADGRHMYFTHSFAFFADDPRTVTATTDHFGEFTAAVAKGNIAGVQFHPEKSQASGLALIGRFLEWRP
ncbi:MAG TPA: imidazole glycerol phosphate synthase subunit HisH [Caulobacteraceae bacterium]|jgi:glutamine amidotransferase|nr:imidazole glycerol phosphate synthase subunit HisH [Caulobacteraceae bacterium]